MINLPSVCCGHATAQQVSVRPGKVRLWEVRYDWQCRWDPTHRGVAGVDHRDVIYVVPDPYFAPLFLLID